MTTATLTQTYRVEHESRPEYVGDDWHVVDAEGARWSSQPTEVQARVRAAELNFEAEQEAEEEARRDEADDLLAEIHDGLDGLGADDLDTLRAVLAALKGR